MAAAQYGKSIGIDLGTTYSCVGAWQNDPVEIIANDQRNPTTLPYVAFPDSERLIGDAIKNQVSINPINTVFNSRRLIGRRFSDPLVVYGLEQFSYHGIEKNGEKAFVQVQYKGETKSFSAK